MAKGYWVAFADESDPEGYKAYIAENAKAFRKHGGRFLTRGAEDTVAHAAAQLVWRRNRGRFGQPENLLPYQAVHREVHDVGLRKGLKSTRRLKSPPTSSSMMSRAGPGSRSWFFRPG